MAQKPDRGAPALGDLYASLGRGNSRRLACFQWRERVREGPQGANATPPMGWSDTTSAARDGTELVGGTIEPESSGAWSWHAPRLPLFRGRCSPL
eukprot:7375992-Prymnesium_polylepis.2